MQSQRRRLRPHNPMLPFFGAALHLQLIGVVPALLASGTLARRAAAAGP